MHPLGQKRIIMLSEYNFKKKTKERIFLLCVRACVCVCVCVCECVCVGGCVGVCINNLTILSKYSMDFFLISKIIHSR